MSRREDIDNDVWSDPDFLALTPNSKLLYLWSFTNPACGMAGVYKMGFARVSFETGLTQLKVERSIDELVDAYFLLYEEQVIWVRTRVRHLRTRTTQMARAIAKDIEKLKADHPIRTAFLLTYADLPWLREQLAVLAPEGGWPESAHVSERTRLQVLERDGYACVACGTKEDLSIDHRKPRSHGGSGRPENLQTMCRSCNTRKGPVSDLPPLREVRGETA